jgi:hypothetical protein
MVRRMNIPGIIDGSMTIRPDPNGGVSFCINVGADDGPVDTRNRLELIISSDYVRHVSDMLGKHCLESDAGGSWMQTFPCHVGVQLAVTAKRYGGLRLA